MILDLKLQLQPSEIPSEIPMKITPNISIAIKQTLQIKLHLKAFFELLLASCTSPLSKLRMDESE